MATTSETSLLEPDGRVDPVADDRETVHVAYGYGLFTGGLGAHYGAERPAARWSRSAAVTERVVWILDSAANIMVTVVLGDPGLEAQVLQRTPVSRSHLGAEPDRRNAERSRRAPT